MTREQVEALLAKLPRYVEKSDYEGSWFLVRRESEGEEPSEWISIDDVREMLEGVIDAQQNARSARVVTVKYSNAKGEEGMQVPAGENWTHGSFLAKDGATIHVSESSAGVEVKIKAAAPIRIYAEDDPEYTPDDPEL